MKSKKNNFKIIIEILAEHNTEFIVVGGVCAVIQGAPVTTFDLDIELTVLGRVHFQGCVLQGYSSMDREVTSEGQIRVDQLQPSLILYRDISNRRRGNVHPLQLPIALNLNVNSIYIFVGSVNIVTRIDYPGNAGAAVGKRCAGFRCNLSKSRVEVSNTYKNR